MTQADDWQEIAAAPLNEPVMVCPNTCDIEIAIQREIEEHNDKGKIIKIRCWNKYPERTLGYPHTCMSYLKAATPKTWRPLPPPPKHLYERKLTADLLEKQVKELRNAD